MINITLPDEKSNYVHRIGRVGRAERMGLAISLVSTVPEKVWYHGEWCSSRGRNCWNTNLTTEKGCCIWINEKTVRNIFQNQPETFNQSTNSCFFSKFSFLLQMLAEIEDHLNITIQQVDKEMQVPVNEFDGKVVYGEKLQNKGTNYQDHVEQLRPIVQNLSKLESTSQLLFLKHMKV